MRPSRPFPRLTGAGLPRLILKLGLLAASSILWTPAGAAQTRQQVAVAAPAGETVPGETPAPEAPHATVQGEPVVVTANRRRQPLDEAAPSVAVVDREDLRLSPALAVDDVLRQIPGFSLFRRSSSRVAHPTTQGVSLRGVGPSGTSRTLVLLDGVPLNDPFGGWVLWSRVPRESLERIEVVSGGGSDLWGSAALGGVIQLLTTVPTHRRWAAAAHLGDRSTREASLTAGGREESLGFLLEARHFDTDGYPIVPRGERGAIDEAARSEAHSATGRLDLQLTLGLSLAWRGNLFAEERGNGTPLTHNRTRGGFLTAEVAGVSRHREWRGSLTAHDITFENTFSSQAPDRASERPALDQRDVGSDAWQASLQGLWDLGGHRLTAGAESRSLDAATLEDFFFSGEITTGRFLRRRRAGGEETLTGLYLQDGLALTPRLHLAVGARLDRWQSSQGLRREVSLETGEALLDERFPTRREVAFSPRLGLVAALAPGITLRGSLYRAFRAPTVNELFRPFRVRNDITAANPRLEPETLTGAEVGLSTSHRTLRTQVTAFWNRLEDSVANHTAGRGPGVVAPCGFVPAGGVCRQRGNLDRLDIPGLEAELRWNPSPAWELGGRYLWNGGKVEGSSTADLVHRRPPQTPEHQGVLDARYGNASWLGLLSLRLVGKQFEDDLNELSLPGFAVLDLAVERGLGERWLLSLGAENLLDREVRVGASADGSFTLGAPRALSLGLRWSPAAGGSP